MDLPRSTNWIMESAVTVWGVSTECRKCLFPRRRCLSMNYQTMCHKRKAMFKMVVVFGAATTLIYLFGFFQSVYYGKENESMVESMRAQLGELPVARGDREDGPFVVANHGGPVGVSRGFSTLRSADQIIDYYKVVLEPLGWKVAEFRQLEKRRQQLTLCKVGVAFEVATVPLYEKTSYRVSLFRRSMNDASNRCASSH